MIDVSIVAPLYNEEANASILYQRLTDVMKKVGGSYEIVFIDDGSRDNTLKIVEEIANKDSSVKVVKLKKNFGQTPALAAGIDNAEGEIIVTMDGDLQHDPDDIPLFLEKMKEGYDIVSGWRKKRVDNFVVRRFPSMVANKMMSIISGVDLHDFGTTFKAYKKDVIKDIELYGEMHRFIPALASINGVTVCEIPIKNILRDGGESNYGLGRILPVLFDLFHIKFMVSYSRKPLHFFGLVGGTSFVLGSSIATIIFFKKIFFGTAVFVEHGPLLFLATILIIFGVQIITFGLLAELLVRIYHNTRNSKIYKVDKIIGGGGEK
ncbi:MAG: glycosyltransferase family 2 protein [Nitrospinae bacterium]|nr:glycosyltransferase family 2 protein [Nitrospinota bacterium]